MRTTDRFAYAPVRVRPGRAQLPAAPSTAYAVAVALGLGLALVLTALALLANATLLSMAACA